MAASSAVRHGLPHQARFVRPVGGGMSRAIEDAPCWSCTHGASRSQMQAWQPKATRASRTPQVPSRTSIVSYQDSRPPKAHLKTSPSSVVQHTAVHRLVPVDGASGERTQPSLMSSRGHLPAKVHASTTGQLVAQLRLDMVFECLNDRRLVTIGSVPNDIGCGLAAMISPKDTQPPKLGDSFPRSPMQTGNAGPPPCGRQFGQQSREKPQIPNVRWSRGNSRETRFRSATSASSLSSEDLAAEV